MQDALGRPGEVELPHLLQVLPAETAAEARRQIRGKALDQCFAIRRPLLSSLVVFDDPPVAIARVQAS